MFVLWKTFNGTLSNCNRFILKIFFYGVKRMYRRVVLDWQLEYHTYIIFINVKSCRTVWRVGFAAYLPWFSLGLLLGGDDCGVELGCHVVTRPPVGSERWCTAGCAVDWPRVRGGTEEDATGADVGLSAAAGCSDEPWWARSTRLRGRAVGCRVFHLEASFLHVLFTDTPFTMNEFCCRAKPSQSVNWGRKSTSSRGHRPRWPSRLNESRSALISRAPFGYPDWGFSVIFLSCKANARVFDAKSGHGRHSPTSGAAASPKRLTNVA